MRLGKYVVIQFFIFVSVKALPNGRKQYRTDYEYNKKTNAFYKLHIESVLSYHTKRYCEAEGASLMTPNQQDIVQAHGMLKRYPDLGRYVWIAADGAYHESVEEKPLIDLTPNSAEDDSSFESQNICDVMTRNGEVQTLPCFNELPFICKVEDKDAAYDSNCGVYATGYNYYPEVGSCYKIPNVAFTWNEAYAECQAEGAHLVVINSEAEHAIIQNLTLSSKPTPKSYHSWYFLAGFHAIRPSREFRTVFNQTLEEAGYSAWSYEEPNNLMNSEYCGSVFKSDGKLNDVNCSNRYGFICEKEVHT